MKRFHSLESRSLQKQFIPTLLTVFIFGSGLAFGNFKDEITARQENSSTSAQARKMEETQWLATARHHDVVYFLYQTPGHIQRYDMGSETWLENFQLEQEPTCFYINEDGIYLGYDRKVTKMPLEGGEEAHFRNTTRAITAITSHWDYVYLFNGEQIQSLRRDSGELVDTVSIYTGFRGVDVAGSVGKIFGRDIGVSPSDIRSISISEDGGLDQFQDSPYHGDFPSAEKVFVFPGDGRVADNSGTIYNTSDLTYSNNLNGPFDQLDFYGERPVLLREGVLIAYSNIFAETGRYTPEEEARTFYVSGDEIFYFFESDAGVQAGKVAIDLLNPQEPGLPVDPNGLAYEAETVVIGNEGTVYLLSPEFLSIFRWSSSQKQYLETIPLSSAPMTMTYKPSENTLYLGYENRRITRVNLNSPNPEEVHYVNTASQIKRLLPADDFLLAIDRDSKLIVFNSEGQQILSTYFSSVGDLNWDPIAKRIYAVDYNRVEWYQLNDAGEITETGSMPYQSGVDTRPPLIFSPDYSRILLGTGVILNTSDLLFYNTLSNDINGALWSDVGLFTLRAWDDGTQIQRWGHSNFSLEDTHLFTGSPLGVFPTDSDLLVVTQTLEGPAFFSSSNDFQEFPQPEFPVIQYFTASETSVEEGQSLQLSWQVTGAVRVTLNHDEVESSGSLEVFPHQYETTYLLTASGLGGSVESQITVEIVPQSTNFGLSPPVFINQDHFRLDQQGHLLATLPHPNSDGAYPQWAETLMYNISIKNGCDYYRSEWVYASGDETWPKWVAIPKQSLPPGDYQIAVARHVDFSYNQEMRSDEVTVSGPRTLPDLEPSPDIASHQRWLLHIPKKSGGFSGLLKMESKAPLHELTFNMLGYDSDGNWLQTETITLLPQETIYRQFYETDGLFTDFEDLVSHVAIHDPSGLIRTALRYTSVETQFGTWTGDVNFRDGRQTGHTFEMEGRSSPDSQDGIAVLNLTTEQSPEVWVVQWDRATGQSLGEVSLGQVAPGSKILSVVSAPFNFHPTARYSIETRDPNRTIQIIGLTFINGQFFAPAPVLKK